MTVGLRDTTDPSTKPGTHPKKGYTRGGDPPQPQEK
jgi:hypothetical protein